MLPLRINLPAVAAACSPPLHKKGASSAKSCFLISCKETQTFHIFCYCILAMILWGSVNRDSILISGYKKSLCKLKLYRPDVYLGGKGCLKIYHEIYK